MIPRMSPVWWRDEVSGLTIGDTGSTPIPTTKVTRRPKRRRGAVSGDAVRTFETCNWGPPPE